MFRSVVTSCQVLCRAWRYRMQDEPAPVRFLLDHLRPGQTVIDAGAHKGAFTYWMQRAVGPSGRVFAFEPQPELATYLVDVKRHLRIDQLTVVPAALSDECGSLVLHRPRATPSPRATVCELNRSQSGFSLQVDVETLDGFFAGKGGRPVHFIKCDVEGHELSVFRGASAILAEDRPILLFECESRHLDHQSIEPVFDYLRPFGYKGYFFRGDQKFPLSCLRADDQADPKSPGYVNNFAFLPTAAA